MHYFIDGYNMLFSIYGLGGNLQEQRNHFLAVFREKNRLIELSLTIVFDAHHRIGESTQSQTGPLQVIFTELNINADQYIIHLVKNRPHSIVVTSDKLLAREARHLGAKTETAEEFLEQFDKRYHNRLKRKENLIKKMVRKPLEILPKVPGKKAKKPDSSATFAECFDYYLDVFEEEN